MNSEAARTAAARDRVVFTAAHLRHQALRARRPRGLEEEEGQQVPQRALLQRAQLLGGGLGAPAGCRAVRRSMS